MQQRSALIHSFFNSISLVFFTLSIPSFCRFSCLCSSRALRLGTFCTLHYHCFLLLHRGCTEYLRGAPMGIWEARKLDNMWDSGRLAHKSLDCIIHHSTVKRKAKSEQYTRRPTSLFLPPQSKYVHLECANFVRRHK